METIKNHIANNGKFVRMVTKYVYGNNASCKMCIKKDRAEINLRLNWITTEGKNGFALIKVELDNKYVTLTFGGTNTPVAEKAEFDLDLVFTYELLEMLVENFIQTVIEKYNLKLDVNMSGTRAIKPFSMYETFASKIMGEDEAKLSFYSEPHSRTHTLAVANKEYHLQVDVQKETDKDKPAHEGIPKFYVEATVTENGHVVAECTPFPNKNVERLLREVSQAFTGR